MRYDTQFSGSRDADILMQELVGRGGALARIIAEHGRAEKEKTDEAGRDGKKNEAEAVGFISRHSGEF